MTLPPPPPTLDALPAGHKLVAGLGAAEVLPDFDFETYSEAGYEWDEAAGRWRGNGLPSVGACTYTEHPTAEVLSLAYDLKDGRGRRLWRPGLPPPVDLWAHVMQGSMLEAFNVGFEYWVWSHICHKRMGWPTLRQEQLRCAMAKGRSWCLPGKLLHVGEVLGLATQKDKRGAALLDKFSKPRSPTKSDPRRRIKTLWTMEDVEREVAAYRAEIEANGFRTD